MQIVRRNRLLEPAHVLLRRELLRQLECLLRTIGAVGVDEQTGRPDRLLRRRDAGRVALGVSADLHFDPAATVFFYPARELTRELAIIVAGEAAAAVDRNGIAIAPEQRRQAVVRAGPPSRSQSAVSTAEIAVAARPSRPRLRTATLHGAPCGGRIHRVRSDDRVRASFSLIRGATEASA